MHNHYDRFSYAHIFFTVTLSGLLGFLLYEQYVNHNTIKDLPVLANSCYQDNEFSYSPTAGDWSLMVLNREPDYLLKSSLDYFQEKKENGAISDIHHTLGEKMMLQKKAPLISESVGISCNKVSKREILTKNKTIKVPKKNLGFVWPIDKDKFWLSSLFGPRKRQDGSCGFHYGIDMAAIKGTPVKAVKAGHIVEAHFQPGYGNTVVVQHAAHIKTRYAHLHTIRVRVGQSIVLGSVVGTVGETGFIRKTGKDGSHLHFEVYENGKQINPLDCLPQLD